MRYVVLLLLMSSSMAMQTPPNSPKKLERKISDADLEKAIKDIAELKKDKKPCCRLTKPRVAALTTIISSALTAAVTIATVYGTSSSCPPSSM